VPVSYKILFSPQIVKQKPTVNFFTLPWQSPLPRKSISKQTASATETQKLITVIVKVFGYRYVIDY